MGGLSFGETVAFARDIAFVSMLLAGPLIGFALYRKVKGTAESVRRTSESVKELLTRVAPRRGRS